MTDDKDAISYTSRPTKDQTDQFEKNDKEKKAKAKPNLPKGVKRNLEADIDWLPTSQPETSRQRKLLSIEEEAMMLKMAKQALAKNKS